MRAAGVRVTRFLSALGLAAAIAACVPSPPPGGAGPVGPVSPPLQTGPLVPPGATATVALLVPLTGSNEGATELGAAMRNAARMALNELGASRVALRVYDTAGDPGTAATAASRAVGEGAALILGPLFSANTSAAGAIAARARVPVISFSTDATVAGEGIYVSGYTPGSEAARIVGFARSEGIGTFGVVYPQTPYGRAALEAARAAAGPGAITAEYGYARSFEGIQAGTEAFSDSYAAARPDGVLMPESGQGLRTLGSFLDYFGVAPDKVQYLGLGQWNSAETLREPSLQGGWFPAPEPDRVDAFAMRYRAAFGDTPPVLASLAYDAVLIAAQLLDDAALAGSQEPFGAKEMTRPQGFRGAFGPIRFTADGIAMRSMAILEVAPGGFEVIDPAPAVLGAGS